MKKNQNSIPAHSLRHKSLGRFKGKCGIFETIKRFLQKDFFDTQHRIHLHLELLNSLNSKFQMAPFYLLVHKNKLSLSIKAITKYIMYR